MIITTHVQARKLLQCAFATWLVWLSVMIMSSRCIVAAQVNAQPDAIGRVALKLNNVTLKEALTLLHKEMGIEFVALRCTDEKRTVELDAKNASELLQQLLDAFECQGTCIGKLWLIDAGSPQLEIDDEVSGLFDLYKGRREAMRQMLMKQFPEYARVADMDVNLIKAKLKQTLAAHWEGISQQFKGIIAQIPDNKVALIPFKPDRQVVELARTMQMVDFIKAIIMQCAQAIPRWEALRVSLLIENGMLKLASPRERLEGIEVLLGRAMAPLKRLNSPHAFLRLHFAPQKARRWALLLPQDVNINIDGTVADYAGELTRQADVQIKVPPEIASMPIFAIVKGIPLWGALHALSAVTGRLWQPFHDAWQYELTKHPLFEFMTVEERMLWFAVLGMRGGQTDFGAYVSAALSEEHWEKLKAGKRIPWRKLPYDVKRWALTAFTMSRVRMLDYFWRHVKLCPFMDALWARYAVGKQMPVWVYLRPVGKAGRLLLTGFSLSEAQGKNYGGDLLKRYDFARGTVVRAYMRGAYGAGETAPPQVKVDGTRGRKLIAGPGVTP